MHNIYGVGTIKRIAYNPHDELIYEVFFDSYGKKVTVMRESDMTPLFNEDGKAASITDLLEKMGLSIARINRNANKGDLDGDVIPKEEGLKVSNVKVKKIEPPFEPGSLEPVRAKIIDGGNIVQAINELNKAEEIKPVFGTGFPAAMKKMSDSVKRHYDIVMALNELYAKKNADYGDSFYETFKEEGMAMARIRLTDKLNRFKSLTKNAQQVSDESILDTLDDLANYAIMTRIAIERMAAEKGANV